MTSSLFGILRHPMSLFYLFFIFTDRISMSKMKSKVCSNPPAWMLGSSRAARNREHIFISRSMSLTNFAPEAFKGCCRPPSGLQRGFWRMGCQFCNLKPPKAPRNHIKMQTSQWDMYKALVKRQDIDVLDFKLVMWYREFSFDFWL